KYNFIKFDQNHRYAEQLNLVIADSLKRLIIPRVEREIHSNLKEIAESRSMFVFGKNVHYLLLQKPMGSISILGIDPGYRTGSKWALIDSNGDLQKVGVFFHTPPHLKIEEAKMNLSDICSKFHPKLIAIGNGSGSYETAKFVSDWIKETKSKTKFRIISEAGASVYSASENARKEFPNIDVSYRGAVSIARRVQNPLSELIKTPPESLGVGMYQHDLLESMLHSYLDQEVSIAINQVGVNINTSSVTLMRHISGLSLSLAKRIVEYRSQIKSFSNRNQLLEVKGLGKKTFEQCAGFCRIPGGENPFDNTTIHPESYKIAEKLLRDSGSSQNEFKENPEISIEKLSGLHISDWSKKNEFPMILSKDIANSLLQNVSDFRDLLEDPILYSKCLSFEDLHEGMELKGTTSSITDFGIFIDIGIKYSGFSPLPRTTFEDIYKKYPIGSPVDIIISSLDKERKRIQVQFK
ncbi:MAG: helix-hairpin-helix domain-containing protein, partial [Caldisericia bacterium]|nr:helix-hairpin-helix domain-containing protein [Caldisericia bacterium]